MNKKMDDQYVDEMLRMGKEFFGQFNDPTEIESTRENYKKIVSLHPSAYKFKTNEQGELIAWTVAIPTSKELADDFIGRRITEKELLEKTTQSESYDAVYLFAALTIPKYQKKGYARGMFEKQVQEIFGDKTGDVLLFAWAVTDEGKKLMEAVSRDIGVEIALRIPGERP